MARQANQQQGADNSLSMLWGIIFIFSIIGLLWYFFHTQITKFVLHIRLLESRLIAWFTPEIQSLTAHMHSRSAEDVGFSELAQISGIIGRYLCYPIAAILLLCALWIYRSRAPLRFTKTYTMNSLVEAEKTNWPQITPIASLDLTNTTINEGPWAMALSPLQFAKKHRLIKIAQVEPSISTAAISQGNHNYWIANLQREAARQSFIVQLGQYWQGIEFLPHHVQALFAIFSARIARDREAATHLLHQLACSAVLDKMQTKQALLQHLNFNGTTALLKKHAQHKIVTQITQKHAYVLTVMAAMLQQARQDGVLASAEFLWLKLADRSLWFMLNCVGRQTAFTEIAGPFSHWLAERAIGQKLLVPMVDTAVQALDMALKEVRLSKEILEEWN
jgi:intracellular multiplication protein IcmP